MAVSCDRIGTTGSAPPLRDLSLVLEMARSLHWMLLASTQIPGRPVLARPARPGRRAVCPEHTRRFNETKTLRAPEPDFTTQKLGKQSAEADIAEGPAQQ